jgi:heptaprenyl diphosphate synthase
MNIKRITTLGILLSLSIVLGITDSMISVLIFPFVGVKLGLANIVTLLILFQYNEKDALLITILRVVLVALLRGSAVQTFFMSLSGATLAYLLMVISKKLNLFSMIGISVFGAFGHSVGQILLAIVWVARIEIAFYLPYVLLLSVVTGIFTGIVSNQTFHIMKKANM